MRLFPALLALILALSGCARRAGTPAPSPAPILHLVFCTLKDPAEADSLVAECDRLLAPIPSVRSYACGRHLETGRPGIDTDYHVAIVMGFGTPEDYAAYERHADHQALVAKWAPRLARLVIRDVRDARRGFCPVSRAATQPE